MDNPFFPSTIVINGQEYEFDLADDVSINDADLTGEFCRQAELFAKYSTGYEQALNETGRIKVMLERLCAHLDHQGRMEAKNAGVKFTEKMAENYVKGHADFLAKNEELLNAQKITGLLKQGKDAIVQKRDMLIQLGATQREERKADITMKSMLGST